MARPPDRGRPPGGLGRGIVLAIAGGGVLLLFAGARALRRRRSPPQKPAGRGTEHDRKPLPEPRSKWQLALSDRRVPQVAALLGAALTSSSLRTGFFWDDFILRERLLRLEDARDVIASMTRLFVFVDSRTIGPLMERGFYPWWSARDLKIAFFRPVSSSTHVLDHLLWPRSPWAMHFHNMLWYCAACFLTARFFRRVQASTWVAGLAAVLFALDEAHFMTVQWLSNRNALIALVFGLLSLDAFDRWRKEGWRPGALRSFVFLALSLLSAEIGVATAAYMASYATFLERGDRRRRLLAVLPAGAVVFLWMSAYRKAGFGVTASDTYIDPGNEPLRFLGQLPKRVLLLLLGQFGWQDVAVYNYASTAARKKMLLTAAALSAAMLGIGWPVLRRDAAARFFASGFFLCLLPVSAMQLAGSRLLTFASVGAVGLSAQTVAHYLGSGMRKPWRLAVAALVAGVHLIRAPLRHLERSRSQPFLRLQEEQERFTDVGHDPEVERREVIVVNVPNPFAFFYYSAFCSVQGRRAPRRLRLLAPGYFTVEVERIDARTLLVRPRQGFLVPPGQGPPEDRDGPAVHPVHLYQQHDLTFRSASLPWTSGERTELPGMAVEVTRVTDDGRPLEARIRFAEPLESPAYRWLQWDWSEMAYRLFEPPPIGERAELDGVERSRRAESWAVF